jgi:ABC-type transporter Mla subunit MlaD
MPIRRGPKNNMLAGLFLLISLALALAIFFILSNAWERLTIPSTRYIVEFSLTDGAEGLDAGSPVKLGGERVGQVTGVTIVKDPAGVPTKLSVDIEVRSDITLYEDAAAMLALPLLGTASSINIPFPGTGKDVASPQGGDPKLTAGETLRGQLSPPGFLAQAGYGPEQTMQVQKIIRDAEEVSDRINRMTQKLEADLDPTLEKVNAIVADTEEVTRSARASWKDWEKLVTNALEQIDKASQQLVTLMDDAKAGVDEVRAVVKTGQETLDENRPKVDAALTDFQELADKLNTDTYATLMRMLENGQKGVDDAAAAIDRVATAVARNVPELERTLANARLASDQLKLTMIEVRQAPWKILATPSGRKQYENEILYDSVRTYAAAVSDLRSAAASLDSLAAANGNSGDIDKRTIQEVSESLSKAFERYQQAERDFLAKWAEAAK